MNIEFNESEEYLEVLLVIISQLWSCWSFSNINHSNHWKTLMMRQGYIFIQQKQQKYRLFSE
jgi:hypothetical protein